MYNKTEMPAGPQNHIARHTGLVWLRDRAIHSENIFSNRLADKLWLKRFPDSKKSEWLKEMEMIQFFWKWFRGVDHMNALAESEIL
jgi:hypothetical protein